MATRNRLSRAFTLIEVMMVIMMLGILAAIIAPRFNDSTDEARESAVQSQLRILRGQLQIYHDRHGAWPNDLETLMQVGYLSGPPIHPGAGEFAYNRANGILTSSVDPDW